MAKHRQEEQPVVPARRHARHAQISETQQRDGLLSPPRTSMSVLTLTVAALAAVIGAPVALISGQNSVAATVGMTLLGVAGLTAWLSVAATTVGAVRGSRRDTAGLEPAAPEGTSTAAHRATRPRPRPPWYSGVEVSFELA